jgi:hypothetical protein
MDVEAVAVQRFTWILVVELTSVGENPQWAALLSKDVSSA